MSEVYRVYDRSDVTQRGNILHHRCRMVHGERIFCIIDAGCRPAGANNLKWNPPTISQREVYYTSQVYNVSLAKSGETIHIIQEGISWTSRIKIQ